jgi:hypothetical protein
MEQSDHRRRVPDEIEFFACENSQDELRLLAELSISIAPRQAAAKMRGLPVES